MLGSIWKNTRAVIVFLGLIAVIAALAGGVARTRAGLKKEAHAAVPWAPPPTSITGPEVADAFAAVASRITPAVVRIETERMPEERRGRLIPRPLQNLLPGDSGSTAPEMSGGTGFLVSADGYILTNNHVIEGADFITVTLYDKRSLSAQVIGLDPTTDVALIKIEGDKLPNIPLGDSDRTRVGEWVLAIGNPGFDATSTLDFTVTGGIISAKGRPLRVLSAATENGAGNFAIEDFLQTDAAINPGNSGGPLVNLQGEVVGVNSAIASLGSPLASDQGGNIGVGFAIPIEQVQVTTAQILKTGKAQYPVIGASVGNTDTLDGATVEDITPGQPAAKADLEVGDVIRKVDGNPVSSSKDLVVAIRTHVPGDKVTLTVERGKKTFEVEVGLEAKTG